MITTLTCIVKNHCAYCSVLYLSHIVVYLHFLVMCSTMFCITGPGVDCSQALGHQELFGCYIMSNQNKKIYQRWMVSSMLPLYSCSMHKKGF